jgi:hypothetical protein
MMVLFSKTTLNPVRLVVRLSVPPDQTASSTNKPANLVSILNGKMQIKREMMMVNS